MAGASTITATLSFNVFFCIVTLLVFEYLRLKIVDIYSPNSRYGSSPQPNKKPFGWIWQVAQLSDREMLKLSGLDGYVFLRFIKLCAKISSICTIGAIILMPIYSTAAGHNYVNGVDILSMANIEAQGSRLWASWLFVYIFTGIFLVLFHLEYEHFAEVRNKYFTGVNDHVPAQVKFTVMVENIPQNYRTSEQLTYLFNEIFPGQVMFAHVAVRNGALDQAVAARDRAKRALEEVSAIFAVSRSADSRPTVFLKNGQPLNLDECFFCCCNLPCSCRVCTSAQAAKSSLRATAGVEEIDAIQYWTGQLALRCELVKKLQGEAYLATGEKAGKQNRTATRQLKKKANSRNHTDFDPSEQGFSGSGGFGAGDDDDSSSVQSGGSGGSMRGLATSVSHTLTEVSDRVYGIKDVVLDKRDSLASRFASATGFVTFQSRRAQLAASHAPVLCFKHPGMKVIPAPEPTEVIWNNCSVSPEQTENVSYLTAAMFYMGLLFWSGILAFVAALSSLSTLERYFPFLHGMDASAYAIFQGILPVVVMMCFTKLISVFMTYVARNVERHKTQTAVQEEVFKWYYLYQVVNIVLLLVAGSVFDALSKAIKDPASIVSLISAALPTVAVFYINYMITEWFGNTSLSLIQRVKTSEYLLVRLWYPNPQRITRNTLVEGPFEPQGVQYGVEQPKVLYVLTIVLLYWVIAPLLLPFSAGAFWSTYMVNKYQYVFINQRSFDHGGKYWYDLYFYSMAALLVSSVTFMTYMGVKEGISQTPLLLPLPAIIVYCWRHTEKRFKSLSMNLPYDAAVREDSDVFTDTPSSTNPAIIAETDGPGARGSESALTSDVELGLLSKRRDLLDTFSPDFFKQPNLIKPAMVQAFPHRIGDTPLLTKEGGLHSIYLKDTSAEMGIMTGNNTAPLDVPLPSSTGQSYTAAQPGPPPAGARAASDPPSLSPIPEQQSSPSPGIHSAMHFKH